MKHMNKLFRNSLAAVATAALLLSAGNAEAKTKKKKTSGKSVRAAFEKGDNTIAVGIGIGTVYSYTDASFAIPFTVSYDHGLIGEVGPGTIGIGGVVSYMRVNYDYNYFGSGYSDTWTNLVIGVRGTYHLTLLKNKSNKFDPYAGVTVGVRSFGYHDDYDNSDNQTEIYPFAGLFVGAKYNFSKHVGAWAELGYDVSLLRLGINFNF